MCSIVHKKTSRVVAACLGLLVLVMLCGCSPVAAPEAPPVHIVTPVYSAPEPTPLPSPDSARLNANHVIVTGYALQVDQVIAAISGASQITYPINLLQKEAVIEQVDMPKLEQEDRLGLGYLQEVLDTCPALAPYKTETFGQGTDGGLVMDLYRIKDGDLACTAEGCPAAEVAARINKLARASGYPLFADLAYSLSPVEGAPWTGGDSPWTDKGSAVIGDPAAALDAFWSQWPFGDGAGIGLIQGGQRTVSYTGDDVWVGVFDTHPYGLPGEYFIDWVTPPFTITFPFPQPPAGYAHVEVPLFPTNDHGLFVAGLVHAVAPDARISLYRVLDEEGKGDLWTLNSHLHQFISETLSGGDRPPKGAVINLSLGSPVPPEWLLPMLEGAPSTKTEDRIMSLRTLVAAAHCHNIPVIAAAGNAGSQVETVPAIFPETLAVASSNHEGNASCFTSPGDVSAPGGDGKEGCMPALDRCTGSSCDCALIGPVDKFADEYPTGYAYWAGSSFSAPLVSGLAALLLDKAGGQITADEVAAAILAGVCPPPGSGSATHIINVPRTLLGIECPSP